MVRKYKMTSANSYDAAYAIGAKYIKHMEHTQQQSETPNFDLPRELGNPIWEISLSSLANTLKYIFEFLHHQCYMLCVHGNNVVMCKLEMQSTAPVFREIINKHIEKLDDNSELAPAQTKYIREYIDNNRDKLRVMQCIVKTFGETDTSENEYLKLLRGLELPDGVFIMNLTDAIILRRDGKSPFQMTTGRVQYPEYNFSKHLPILSMSGQRNYLDIPIPNYDDIAAKPLTSAITVWEEKRKNIAVFRGGPTGCGYTSETNMRIKLGSMSNSPLLDVRITKPAGARNIDTKSIRFDPKYGLGMMNTRMNFENQFLNMAQQSNYKYIIHVDGNVNAYRLLTTMATGSLVLRVMSQYTSWAEHLMKHKVHYIPVRADLSDLLDVIKWCRKNDDKCKEIARNGMLLAQRLQSKAFIKSYMRDVLYLSTRNTTSKQNDDTPQNDKPDSIASIIEEIKNAKPASDNRDDLNENAKPASDNGNDLIEIPVGKKRCPKGYSSVSVSNRKMCKKNTTAKKR